MIMSYEYFINYLNYDALIDTACMILDMLTFIFACLFYSRSNHVGHFVKILTNNNICHKYF